MKHNLIFFSPDRSGAAQEARLEETATCAASTTADPVRLEIAALSVLNYALQQNRIPVLQSVTVVNPTADALENITLYISSDPALCVPTSVHIDYIPARSTYDVRDISLLLDNSFFSSLTEKTTGVLWFKLSSADSTLCVTCLGVTALAFDEWHGPSFYPELLAAFVTPNHPCIAEINAAAAAVLAEWSGDPSLDGYQSKDPNRVLLQAAAVFTALQQQHIVYAVPPIDFEQIGQRVRLCDMIMQQKLATCLDFTLFYAACLEACGLHPLLLLQEGHIFAGVWLEAMSFPEAVSDDPSLITKRLADGIHEIAVVECTLLADGKHASFDDACDIAAQSLTGTHALEYIIDVSRARLSGISPLPLRVAVKEAATSETAANTSNAPTPLPTAVFSTEPEPETPEVSKKILWERKLLDLGLRNTLVNMRMSKTMIPLLSPSLDETENVLASGSDFAVFPRPADWHIPASELGFENMHDLGSFAELIQSEFKAKRLRSSLGDAELTRTIRELYRSSKTVMEENGSNTLYLALGLLRWYETDRSTKPRYAPIVLLPVELIRKSAALGYVIRLRDDEPQMNITMLEKLKQDFDIVIHGLDPLPQDEHGIDIRRVLTVLRKAIMCRPRWDVLESSYLGIFSFSQFVMWNDIRNRADDLAENKIVRSLMDGKLAWDAEPMEIADRVPEEGVLLPLPADASQLFAIQAACRNESFVLHGPPGTGKSQTITALIANALAQDKTVLFVAEKMAALEVVQKRLTAIGIEPFCLELHSNKAKKKAVLEQLNRVTEVTRFTTAEEYAHRAEQLAHLRAELDTYAAELHRVLPHGMTLHELIDRYEEVRHAPDVRAFSASFAEKATQSLLEQQIASIEQLVAAAKAVGHPHNHPLCMIGSTQYSQHLRAVLSDNLQQYRHALQTLASASTAFAEAIGESGPFTYDALLRLSVLAKELSFWATCPRAWSTAENAGHYLHAVRKMAQHFIEVQNRHREISKYWHDGFFTEDGAALSAKWKQAGEKWFAPRAFSRYKLKKHVATYAKIAPDSKTLDNHFADLAEYQAEKAIADALWEQYGPDLGDLGTEANTDWPQIYARAKAATESLHTLQTIHHAEEVRHRVGGIRTLVPTIDAMNAAWTALEAPKSTVESLLLLTFDKTNDWLTQQLSACDTIDCHRDEVKEWISWNAAAANCRDATLDNVIDAYCGGLAHEDVLPAYRKAVLNALIMHAIDRCPALNTFSGAVFNEKLARFKRLDQEMITVAQKEIFCRLAAKVPNFTREAVQSSEIGILQRAIRSGGRGISIRKLFEQIPNLLPRLCPCMLMSPISAAQYLDPQREPFNIVVFDEASQLPTGKAVGALARGQNAVIVGDPKQMPPTTFFATNTIDDDNPAIEDLESILDDCLAINMPQTHLLWHYRSRHESLIAFSNSRFYNNKLYTFPSVNDRASKVRLVHVDGVFDRGHSRQNQAEAEAILAELQRRCHDPALAKMSVGVVTFNIAQQNLIDDLLTEACKTDPQLEAWAFESEEPVFIKNLENVQGDERDAILFSIGYGPDENGRVYMNFGPLNRDGGWRRLNVAVSRARCEMVVFATLRPEQIDLSRSGAEGVAALKAFLEYAAGVPIPQDENSVAAAQVTSCGIADTICRFLQKNGYETDRSVGHSAYRIDIGVIDPAHPDQYLLGILLDGAAYGAAKTTRDRELTQLDVLNGLGWHILRVWTMDWWDNRRKELARILTELENIRTHPEQSAEITRPVKTSVPNWTEDLDLMKAETPESAPYTAVPYSPTSLRKEVLLLDTLLQPQMLHSIQRRITMVVNHEAPVSEDLLLRRVAQSYGFARVVPRLQDRFDEILHAMRLKQTLQDDGTRFYWKRGQSPSAYTTFRVGGVGEYKRDPRDVPVQEAANAVYRVLYDQISLSEVDLLREAAKQLGFQRLSASVIGLIANALRYAKRKKSITLGANGNWILNLESDQKE